MTDIIDNYLLRKLLRDGKSWQDILQFCQNRDRFCLADRSSFCKKILQAKFGKVKPGTNYCKVVEQFLQVKRAENEPAHIKTQNFVISKRFLDLVFETGNGHLVELKKFLNDNGMFAAPVILASHFADTPIEYTLPRSGSADTIELKQIGARVIKRKSKKISKKKK